MNTLEQKKQLMRDYWLDSLTGNQPELFETEWFASDEDAELLEIVRGDLIEDYLTDSLKSNERNQFEKHFLINNLEEVAIAKSYFELSQIPLEQTAKPGFFATFAEAVRNFYKIPQIAFAVLLLGGLALFVSFYNFNEPVDLAQIEPSSFDLDNKSQNAPSPVSNGETGTGADDKSSESGAEIKNNNQKADTESDKPISIKNKIPDEKILEKPAQKTIKPLVLFLTNFRGSVKTLKLSDESVNFSLKLDMPGIDKAYRNYEIRIYNSKNELIVRQKLNDNLSLKKSGEKIEIKNLSVNKFKRNDTYKTSLVGYDENDKAEELSLYDSFKID